MEDLNRDATKFYDKIRQYVEQIEPSPRNSSPSVNEAEKIYAKVTKEEMESILKAYDEQQNDDNKSNQSVSCSGVKGGSYAKMLYAKQDFHFLGATDNLTRELQINDLNRDSFLGGYSTFRVTEFENINGLKKRYVIAAIKKIIEAAHEHMNKQEHDRAIELIEKALKFDPNSGLAKMARGQYHVMKRSYEQAASDFREALQCEVVDKGLVKKNLSNALFQQGMNHYHRSNWSNALALFRQSLDADPENDGARLHYELSQDRLRSHQQSAFRPAPPRYRG